MTSLYDKIKDCNSLRSVKLDGIEDENSLLDAVEANQNVQQWTINYG